MVFYAVQDDLNLHILHTFQDNFLLDAVPLSFQAEVASVILALQALMAEGCLEKSRFHATLMQHSHLPLELLWIFAKEGILNVEAYVSKLVLYK